MTTSASVLTKAQDIEFADGVTTVGQPRNPNGSSANPTQSTAPGKQSGAKDRALAKKKLAGH